MTSFLFHVRREIASYAYQGLLQLMAWALRLRRRNVLVLLFGLGCIGCGIAFTFWPATMASVFEFNNLSPVAETDIRAYYGTMLVMLGIAMAWMASRDGESRTALLVIAAFSLGSAIGRMLGFIHGTPFMSIHGFLVVVETVMGSIALRSWSRRGKPLENTPVLPVLDPQTPEDFQPLSQQGFANPYGYYKMLRDRYPVYKMPGKDFYILSRHDDICAACLDTDTFSSKLVEIIVTGKPKPASRTSRTAVERLGDWGLIPLDVMALQDPPMHTVERKIGHAGFNARFVKSLEGEVTQLCREMMDGFMHCGNVEFIQEFAWKLPMRLVIRLMGLPESDFEQIKAWCVKGIESLSGVATRPDLVEIGASNAPFMRYLWRHYLKARNKPQDNFTGLLQNMVKEGTITDQQAVSMIFQLLIAGSDSSASSMGNAIRMLAQNPGIEAELRANPERINDFIEEVFRCESAFQGHFRVTTRPVTLHGVTIPADSRVFLLWASANRDERFWEKPDEFSMNRSNGKKHLTFGHGVHACIGRELARMEIRIVIRELLARTKRIAIVGETPFIASIFARTLVSLPLAFELADPSACCNDNGTEATGTTSSRCPFSTDRH